MWLLVEELADVGDYVCYRLPLINNVICQTTSTSSSRYARPQRSLSPFALSIVEDA